MTIWLFTNQHPLIFNGHICEICREGNITIIVESPLDCKIFKYKLPWEIAVQQCKVVSTWIIFLLSISAPCIDHHRGVKRFFLICTVEVLLVSEIVARSTRLSFYCSYWLVPGIDHHRGCSPTWTQSSNIISKLPSISFISVRLAACKISH